MGFLDKVKGLFSSDRSGGGLLGEPGDTQRPGPSGGGPSGGPEAGGSVGPAQAEPKPD